MDRSRLRIDGHFYVHNADPRECVGILTKDRAISQRLFTFPGTKS